MAPSKNGSVEVESNPEKGHGKIRRCYLSPQELIARPKSAPEVDVLTKVLERSARLFPNQNAVGWRDVVKMHEEEKEVTKTVGGKEVKEKKKWQFYELSDYKYWTYKELYDVAVSLGSALVAKGITPETNFNIYSSTSYRWQAMAQGCASQGITFATAYDSLGDEGLQHSLSLPECRGVFTNANLLDTLARVIEKCPTVKLVVYDGKKEEVKADTLQKLKSANEGIEIIHFDDFLAYGKENKKNPNPPQPKDTACIMFTSGSTGAPKGVILTNANIIAAIAGVETLLGSVIRAGESYIAYLPLAHILEFVVECCMMYVGAPMGYGTVKTLTDNSVRNCVGDIRAFKPTIMVGVPAVWELIRKGILAKVKAGGAVKQKLFNGALSAKRAAGAKSLIGSITDAVVFKAVKEGTGGRLRWALSGGAPISRETQEFLSLALVTVLQGYGMTESTAMCAILPPDFHQYGTVGVPVPSVEVKLVDVPDANYFSSSDPPEGEVWIRGPSVTAGYYKQPDITKETITDDGWLATGDIGRWNKDGTLSLIDRKKNLVKLSGGEYIALERLESIYKSCQYVSNICVYATSDASRPMAIVFPHEQNLKSIANDDIESMCKSKEVRDTVLRELNAVGKKAGLKPLETLQTVVLTPQEWTPQNYLTAAQKLNRKKLIEAYKSEIDKVYP